MKETLVLDSYALIAHFEKEAAGVMVKDLLGRAARGECSLVMSVVNWGEILYSTMRTYGDEKASLVKQIIELLPLKIIDADKKITYEASLLKAKYSPMAYADCFAAALAKNMNAALVTGDKEFKKLEDVIKIKWL